MKRKSNFGAERLPVMFSREELMLTAYTESGGLFNIFPSAAIEELQFSNSVKPSFNLHYPFCSVTITYSGSSSE